MLYRIDLSTACLGHPWDHHQLYLIYEYMVRLQMTCPPGARETGTLFPCAVPGPHPSSCVGDTYSPKRGVLVPIRSHYIYG